MRCSATRKDGQPCGATAVRNGLCAGHAGLGLAASKEAAEAASALGHKARAERTSKARKTASQVYREAVERHAAECVRVRVAIMRDESAPAIARLQAMEQLENRALGRAVQPTEDLTPKTPETVDQIRALSPEERRALLRDLESRLGVPKLRDAG